MGIKVENIKDLGHKLFFASLILGYILSVLVSWNIHVPEDLLFFLFEENYFFEVISCVFIAAKIIFILKKKGFKGLTKLDYLFIGVGIFIIGEENSWGFHFFDYPLGSFFLNRNIQHETNIHNLILYNGIPFEALMYIAAVVFIARTFLKKEFRELSISFKLRVLILVQYVFLIINVCLGEFFNDVWTFDPADMNEELLEYTISYFALVMDLDKLESVTNTRKNGLKAILIYR